MILDIKDKNGFVFEEIGPVRCSIEDMVRWAGSCDDFTNFHYEASAAQARGFRAPVINGPWKAMVIRNLLNVWLGSEVKTLKFSIKYLDTDFVGEEMYMNGRVIEVISDSDDFVQLKCEIKITNGEQKVTTEAHCEVQVQAEQISEIPMARLLEVLEIGTPKGPFVYEIAKTDVERYSRVIGKKNPTDSEFVPTTFFGALDPIERRDLCVDDFLLELPLKKVGGGNAFNKVVYKRPLKTGEKISVTTTYVDAYIKKSGNRTLLFRIRENIMADESGIQVAHSRNGHVLAFALPNASGSEAVK
jgi:acyl dehydratase